MYRRDEHDKTQYKCIYCHKVFRKPKKLYNHLHIHDKLFTCPVNYPANNCLEKFNTKRSLQWHLINKHFQKRCCWLPSLSKESLTF